MVISLSQEFVELTLENLEESPPVVRLLLHPESSHEEIWFLPRENTIIPDRDGEEIPLRSTETAIVGPEFELGEPSNFLSNREDVRTLDTIISSWISELKVDEDTKKRIIDETIDETIDRCAFTYMGGVWAANLKVRLMVDTVHWLEEVELEDEEVKRWIQEYQEMDEATTAGLMEKFMMEDDNSETCTICLEEMIAGGSDVGRLSCLHLVHVHCLKKFLKTSRKCPVCRAKLA